MGYGGGWRRTEGEGEDGEREREGRGGRREGEINTPSTCAAAVRRLAAACPTATRALSAAQQKKARSSGPARPKDIFAPRASQECFI